MISKPQGATSAPWSLVGSTALGQVVVTTGIIVFVASPVDIDSSPQLRFCPDSGYYRYELQTELA
jgi:hypothetical protein